MKKKYKLCDHGMDVGTRWAGLGISENADRMSRKSSRNTSSHAMVTEITLIYYSDV